MSEDKIKSPADEEVDRILVEVRKRIYDKAVRVAQRRSSDVLSIADVEEAAAAVIVRFGEW